MSWRDEGLLTDLENWIKEFDRILFIPQRGAVLEEFAVTLKDSKAAKHTKKKVLLLAAEEKRWDFPAAVWYRRLDAGSARALWQLYHMYEFSDRFQMVFRPKPFSGEERMGSLFHLVDTGVFDMEEVWEALLH